MRRLSLSALLVAFALAAAPWALAGDAVPENVRIKLLTPADAAPGLRVFRAEGGGPMDGARMGALMNRALENLASPDGVIESASGERVTVGLASGEKLEATWDAESHSWDGHVLVVVLPQ